MPLGNFDVPIIVFAIEHETCCSDRAQPPPSEFGCKHTRRGTVVYSGGVRGLPTAAVRDLSSAAVGEVAPVAKATAAAGYAVYFKERITSKQMAHSLPIQPPMRAWLKFSCGQLTGSETGFEPHDTGAIGITRQCCSM